MRKALVVLLVLMLCIPMVSADSSQVMDALVGMPDVEEFKLVTIGLTSVMYVAVAELYYVMGEEIPGMSGTVDFTGSETDISWKDCDLAPVLGSDASEAGAMVIDHGTHKMSIDGELLSNKIDLTITFRQADELDGTYRIIFETRTSDAETGGEEELVAFLVNGKDIKDALQALEEM